MRHWPETAKVGGEDLERHYDRPVSSVQQQQIRRLLTTSLKSMYGRKRLEERLPTFLGPEESILLLAIAARRASFRRQMIDSVLVIATDERLILVPRATLQAESPKGDAMYRPESIPYDKIGRVEEHLPRLRKKGVTLETDHATVHLTSMWRREAVALAEVLIAHADARA